MQSMKYLTIVFTLLFGHLCASGETDCERNPLQDMRNMMKNIRDDNDKFMAVHRHDDRFFELQELKQCPRTTIVGCADSRVHTTNFDLRPLGDIFFIRNIGNQIEPCLGSIDYGILHQHTSLLIFLGHSKCGAVTAVSKGDDVEESIKNELAPMVVTHRGRNTTNEQIDENIFENVHHQVSKAYTRYQELVDSHQLWIVGAVYDFTRQGRGELKVIQVNNRTDLAYINEFLEDVDRNGQESEPLPTN